MKNWKYLTHFAGLDWAKDHHDIIVLDAQVGIVAVFRIERIRRLDWHDWQERIQAFPGLAVAIETRQGAAIEKLMATAGWPCLSSPPHQRTTVSGSQSAQR